MARMKLNLRDFFWLILVVALVIASLIERQTSRSREAASRAEQTALTQRIAALESERAVLIGSVTQVPGGTRVTQDNPESSGGPWPD
jgi:hypothetical protein